MLVPSLAPHGHPVQSWISGCGGLACLSCTLGSGLSKSPLVVLGSMLFVCGLSFYLDVVDSHLLLSLAGL